MATHVLCDLKDLGTLRFRHLGQYFMKQGDFKDISVSRILLFVPDVRLLGT
jgi:hypothetical protein